MRRTEIKREGPPNRARLLAGLLGAGALITVGGVNALGLSSRNPILLKALAPYSGAAAANWTEVEVRTAQVAPDMESLREKSLDVLKREPLDFRAARTLALVDVFAKREDAARAKFAVIADHTLRESITHIWLMDDYYKRGDYRSFLDEGEIVMRAEPQTAASVYTLLTQLIDKGKMGPEIAQKVAAKPEWRAGFLDAFGEQSKNSEAAFSLFKSIKAQGAPASSSELRVWLLHELGRSGGSATVQRWKSLRIEPPGKGERYVRNGDMEGTTAPQPFDWTFFLPEGNFAEISASPNGPGKSLFVELKGRDPVIVARQVLDLPPGSYALDYRVFPLVDLSRRDLRIGIDCAQGNGFSPVVDHSVSGPLDGWSRGKLTFDVGTNCPAQQITIGMKPDGLTSSLQAYFDDFVITPIG